MIKYNSNTINDWNFGTSNLIKVYRNNAIVFYKITSGDTPTPVQEPCFAVVDDISQYSETEFEDVYDKATEKWYKLNNLNQYEQYGIYGSGRTITYYDGKLTIDDGYEYIYSGGSWVNVGEVSGSTQIIKSPEYIEKNLSHSGKINLDYLWKTNSKMQFKFYSTNNGGGVMIGEDANLPDNNDCRMFFASTTAYFDWGSSRISWSSNGKKNTLYEYEYGNYYIKNMVTSASKTGSTISTSRTNPLYLGTSINDRFRTYYIKFYDGDTLVKDFIPWTDMNGNYGLFDKVSLSVYNVSSGSLTGSSNVTDVEVGGVYEYPLEYPVIQDPPDNLVFSSMAEAESYECPWVGMKATIDGDKYIFSGDSISGYEWVYQPSRLPQGYTELQYFTLPQNGSYATTAFNIKNKMNTDYKYSISFTPLDWETNSYYKHILGGNDSNNAFSRIWLYPLDNGWGDIYHRVLACLYNYNIGNGTQLGGGLVGAYAFHDNAKATVTMFLPNGVSGNGATIVVENEGYQTYSGTNTSKTGTVVTDNVEYDMPIFTRASYDSNGATKVPYCHFYYFRVQDSADNDIYYYLPVIRDSDNKVGLFDIVKQEFYYPTNFNFVAGPPI